MLELTTMRDYTPVIPKLELEHGAYYQGRCRNASIARWDGNKQRFVYYRNKFGHEFLEEIKCPEDDIMFDVFVAEAKLETPTREIPLKE